MVSPEFFRALNLFRPTKQKMRKEEREGVKEGGTVRLSPACVDTPYLVLSQQCRTAPNHKEVAIACA